MSDKNNSENKFNIIIDHIIDIKSEQARQGEQIDRNTEDLKDHIEGVIQNRVRIEDLEVSDIKRKSIAKFLVTIASVIGGATAVASAIYKYLI